MGQRSSLEFLPQELRALVRQLWGKGATIDQLTELLRTQLGKDSPSRAAIGRYTKRLREQQEKASARNAYLRELIQCFPPESRENLTAVVAEQLKVKVFEFLGELEELHEFRTDCPDKYGVLMSNLGRALQSYELALNNSQKRRHDERKALLDEVRAKLEKDRRIDQQALGENLETMYA